MKILKYIAIGLCVLFTMTDLAIKFAVWSGFSVWLATNAPVTNGRVLGAVLLMGAMCFIAGWDIARAKFSSCQSDKN